MRPQLVFVATERAIVDVSKLGSRYGGAEEELVLCGCVTQPFA
jgi:hypothetical protein